MGSTKLAIMLRGHQTVLQRKLAAQPDLDTTIFANNLDLAKLCHAIVNRAKYEKLLITPLLCPKCNNPKKKDQMVCHHPDYALPLGIDWLCHSCHQIGHHLAA